MAVIAGGLLAAPRAAEAQPATIRRIGVLSPASPGPSSLLGAFQQGLRELGYVEGQNIRLEYRFAETGSNGWPASPPSWSASKSMSSLRSIAPPLRRP